MSAKYDLYETPDVQNTGEQQPLHARIVPSGTYSKKEFLERVSHSSQTFNYNVIDAVVGIVIDELAEALSEGYVVELGELGHFSISLKCTHKVMTNVRFVPNQSVLITCICALPKSSKGRLSVK